MRVLIIEDDLNKSEQLLELVRALLPEAEVLEHRSYQSGLAAVRDGSPDLVLLDMSMPTFDVTVTDKGGRTRAYGGRDILDEIKRYGFQTKTIVVTGFDKFGEGRDRKTLRELAGELQEEFEGNYLGAVFYHRGQAAWRTQLTQLILKAIEDSEK